MFLAAVLLGASSFQPATLDGGLWHSSDGKIQIQFHQLDFVKLNPRTGKPIECVTTWPIREPQASAHCQDGKRHKLYFDMRNRVIIFDGVSLQQSEGEALD